MDSLTAGEGRHERPTSKALRHGQTWVMSILYIGTFGSFIGFSFALPLVIKNTFPEFLAGHPFIATYLAGLGFVGALIGSIARPLGGWLSDRLGGARVTLAVLPRHGACSRASRSPACNEPQLRRCSSAPTWSIFLLAGHGQRLDLPDDPVDLRRARARGGRARRASTRRRRAVDFKRQAAAVIGIAGAIGAFGGFLIQVVLRQASLGVVGARSRPPRRRPRRSRSPQAHADWSVPALWVFLGAYVVFAGDDVVLLPAEVLRDRARAEPRARVGVGRLRPRRARRAFFSPRRARNPFASSSRVLFAGALNFDTVCGAYVPRDPSLRASRCAAAPRARSASRGSRARAGRRGARRRGGPARD